MIILNEATFAERCLEHGLSGEKPYRVLFILAKYFYHEKQFTSAQVKQMLTAFLNQYYACYHLHEQMWEQNIHNIVCTAKQKTLQKIDGVCISENELENIRQIGNATQERLMFTLLCLAKLNNIKNKSNNNWVNYDWKTIFTLAHISGGNMDRAQRLNRLYDIGYIQPASKNTSLNVRVVYINDDSPIAFCISDFRELGLEYVNYVRGGFARCQGCGKLYAHTKHNRLYCDDCRGQNTNMNKFVVCEDCGRAFTVSAKNHKTTRCRDCQNTRRRELYHENKE